VLVVAACSAPGWLWSTEFGGYDALSYHLQLPREWLALGRIQPLEHNVYSFLPSAVEAAYFHLAVLRSDAVAAACACQILHAAFGVLAAIAVTRVAEAHAGPIAAAIAFVLTIGTGWIVVAGSLAYNELVVVFLLAVSLLALDDTSTSTSHRSVVLGLLLGSAVCAKLTAAGFVAAPIAAVFAMRIRLQHWLAAFAIASGAMALVLAPWLIHNAVVGGNPVFPFVTSLCGSAHWTAEQANIWHSAHQPAISVADRGVKAFNQWLRFGWGTNPNPAEPWQPQWALLPPAALLAAIYAIARPPLRARCGMLILVLAMQLLFWLLLTHTKSRFLLPAIVPAALLLSITAADVLALLNLRRQHSLLATALLGHACLPVWIYLREAAGAPAAAIGATDLFTGRFHAQLMQEPLLPEHERNALLEFAPMSYWINHVLDPKARVLCIGESSPFYLDNVRYTTTWDRGPMSRVMREFPDDPIHWRQALARDFTHLLVQPHMLRRWQDSGWNDPLLTADRVIAFAESNARLNYVEQASGARLYELSPP
jgi:hypothetical protein